MLIHLLQSIQFSPTDPLVIRGAIIILLLLSIFFVVIIQSGNAQTTRTGVKNLRRIGLMTSNMADQYDTKFALASESTVAGLPRIKAIFIHPIKSCGPIELDRALLTKTGFMYDRSFAFATKKINGNDAEASKWRFISQRTKPLMSQIKTELWLPHKDSDPTDPLVQSGGCVVGTFEDPDQPSWIERIETFFHPRSLSERPRISFILPLNITPSLAESHQVKMKPFGIHHREAKGLDISGLPSIAGALPKLRKHLGIPRDQALALFKCTPDTLTRTDRNLAPLEHIGTPALQGYTDQQPVNINSLSSVHAVSSLLPPENQPLNALRFRANIWMANAPAFEEETWKRFRLLPKSRSTAPRGSVAPTFSVVCRTSRCTMPNVNPETGTVDTDMALPGKKKGKPQPSTTMVRHRTVETGNKAALGYIGMHCVPEDRGFELVEEQEGLYVEVGDEIEVLERGTHLYGSTGNDY